MARTKKQATEVEQKEPLFEKEKVMEETEKAVEEAVAEFVAISAEAQKKRKPRAKKAEAKETVEIKSDKESEIDILKAQVEELKAQLQAQSNAAPLQAVIVDSGEKVHLLWQAPVAEDNVLLIGENGQYGRIVGSTGSAFIPKSDLSRVLDSAMRMFIDKRWMIVVSGLDDEEKESLGVNYKEGELLDRNAFRKMVSLGDKMLDIYPALCEEHQAIVAKRYYEAYKNKEYVKRELIVALNKIKAEPAFQKIIEEMNEADLKTGK